MAIITRVRWVLPWRPTASRLSGNCYPLVMVAVPGAGHNSAVPDTTRMQQQKSLIEAAYTQAVLPVWTEDEAGPFTTAPFPGQHWRPEGDPERYPHEYLRQGTAKQLTLFHPASGAVRVKGVLSTANAVLHPWLEAELTGVLAALPEPAGLPPDENRRCWARWQEGLTVPLSLPADPPPLRMLLVLDNLTGHDTADVRTLAVRARDHAAVYPAEWLVSEHGRIDPADPEAARAQRAAADLPAGDHRLAGGRRPAAGIGTRLRSSGAGSATLDARVPTRVAMPSAARGLKRNRPCHDDTRPEP